MVRKWKAAFQPYKEDYKRKSGQNLSAYKDNVAFAEGPEIEQFAPENQSTSDYFKIKNIESVISLKAETHNFPHTVEPFNGAATGTGGEIRDRMGGGVGSWPIAGTAVYMTAYPRLKDEMERHQLYAIGKTFCQCANGCIKHLNKYLQKLLMEQAILVISLANH